MSRFTFRGNLCGYEEAIGWSDSLPVTSSRSSIGSSFHCMDLGLGSHTVVNATFPKALCANKREPPIQVLSDCPFDFDEKKKKNSPSTVTKTKSVNLKPTF